MRRASGVIIISLVVLAFSQVAVLSQTRERLVLRSESPLRRVEPEVPHYSTK
jgi:hypothetical protein